MINIEKYLIFKIKILIGDWTQSPFYNPNFTLINIFKYLNYKIN